MAGILIKIYLKNGNTYKYQVDTAEQAREHTYEILQGGYRSVNENGVLTLFPPHLINKIKAIPIPDGKLITTENPDEVSGT
jgi:hypothetical protein